MTANNVRLFEGKSLAEWGRELGKSRERMRQLFNNYGTLHADEIDAIKAERKEARLDARREENKELVKKMEAKREARLDIG